MNDALSFCTKGKKIVLQDAARSFSSEQQPDEQGMNFVYMSIYYEFLNNNKFRCTYSNHLSRNFHKCVTTFSALTII